MDALAIVLLIINVLLVVVIAVLLAWRGGQNRALEDRLRDVQQDMADLRASALASQGDAQSLAEHVGAVEAGLRDLYVYIRARRDLERQTAESIHRLETIIAGTQSKGKAGENILEVVISQLPPEWQVRNFTVGNRVVEFGLRLPNNLILPIDSKWAATALVEQYANTDEASERARLKRRIEREVLGKAREVKLYLDPNLTTPYGLAVVPDAVYDLCAGIQTQAFRFNVVLVSYSLFVPYLLLVFQTALRTTHSIDMQRLEAYLASVDEHIEALQAEVEGRMSRAMRMLSNARLEMRTHLSQIRGGLSGVQVSAAALGEEGEAQEQAARR